MDASNQARSLVHNWIVKRIGAVSEKSSLEGMTAWNADPTRPLLGIYEARGLIAPAERLAIEALADRWIERHAGDAAAALCALVHGVLQQDEDRTQSLPLPTTRAERYDLRGELSRGGMGEVLLAIDQILGREVLVKQIRPDRDGVESRSMFLRERQTAARLEHPNIVPVHDAGTHPDGRPFYVMRYIRGDTLKQAIKRLHPRPTGQTEAERSLALRALLGRFLDVCEAVAYAHGRDVPVVHRDIKPGNILLGDFGETQLIDWGLAKYGIDTGAEGDAAARSPGWSDDSGSEPTKTGQRKGTTEYMSPEQAAGEPRRIGPASDVYGLGATLYHILVGSTPFDRASEGVDADIIRGVFPPPRRANPEVAPALEAICLKAMARDPADRYPSAKALAADVERWLADEPVSVCRDPWTTRVARFARRHRTAVTAAGVLVATALAALAVGNEVYRRQRDKQRELKDLAFEQRDRARRNAAALAEVVDKFLIEIADDEWSRFPGTEQPRLEMARLAVERYQDLRRQTPDDDDVLAGLGRALRRAANLSRVVHDLDAAGQYSAEARAVFERLADAEPGSIERTTWLIDLMLDEVTSKQRVAGPGAAMQILLAAESRFERLGERGIPWLAARLAYERGALLVALERFPEAVDALRAAVAIFDEAPPPRFALKVVRVLAVGDLADAWMRVGKTTEAVRTLGDAERLASALCSESHDHPDARFAAASVARIAAAVATDAGDPVGAAERLSAAIEGCDRLVYELPLASGFRRELFRGLVDRAEAALAANDPGAAREAADRALALLDRTRTAVVPEASEDLVMLPPLARAHAARGRAILALDGPAAARPDLESALEQFDQAIAINPSAATLERRAADVRKLLATVADEAGPPR